MKSLTAGMKTHISGAVTTLCSCWKVTREDGHILGFTDHDTDITFEGVVYIAQSGYFRSAISNSATTSVDNLEVKGFLDDETISEADLINGMYDYASVEIFLLNWANLGQGIIRMRYGHFGEVTRWPSGLFVVELRGLMQQFEQTVGQIFTPECRADLGDKRCKITLFPNVRESGKNYNVGERVRIPFLTDLPTVSIPIENYDFEQVEMDAVQPWTFGDFRYPIRFTNRNVIPSEGEFVAAAVQNAGDLYQTLYKGNLEGDPNFPPTDANAKIGLDVSDNHTKVLWESGYNFMSAMKIEADVLVPEAGWGLEISMSKMAGGTVLSTTVLSTANFTGDVEYQTVSAVFKNTFSYQGHDRIRFRFRWIPKAGSVYDQKNPVVLDNTRMYWTSSPSGPELYELPPTPTWVLMGNDAWVRGGFELGTDFGTGTVWGWNAGGFARRTANNELAPFTGNAYAVSAGTSTPGYMSKLLGLLPSSSPVSADLIDAGETILMVNVPISQETSTFVGKVQLRFFTAASVYIANKDIESQWIKPPERGWIPIDLRGAVPPLARAVEIRLWADKTDSTQVGFAPRIAYDHVQMTLAKVGADTLDYSAFGGVEFVCVDNGITDMNVPTITPTVGTTVTDGTVGWQIVDPIHAFLCTVTEVTNYTTFKATGCPKPTNWVQFGVMTWLTGPNKGRKIECASFTAPDQFVSILPQPYKPSVGEKFMVHTGCDKNRTTCQAKFANILNFRGEPDVPGTGQYFKVAVP